MKKTVVLFLLIFVLCSIAAEFRVVSFEKNAMDLTARKNDTKLADVNGNECAVIKVMTDLKDIIFDSNKIERSRFEKAGEYWVYIQKNAKRMKIAKEGIDNLIYTFPEKIDESTVYVLKLTADGIIENAEEVAITVLTDPREAEITFDGENKGTPKQITTYPGKHKLRIEKTGYDIIEEEITVTYDSVFFEYKLSEAYEIFVKGGTFQMGSTRESEEQPIHSVTLSDFYIGKYEVTQSKWEEVMGSPKLELEFKTDLRSPLYPVVYVTWNQAIAFCNRLSIKEGLEQCYSGYGEDTKCNFNANGYRLPTEAEWEYAARGGNKSKGYEYSGADHYLKVANISKSLKNVGLMEPNELGLYDMSGNVRELCWDWDGPYGSEVQVDPAGPEKGEKRIIRGGGHKSFYGWCTVSFRDHVGMEWNDYLGNFHGIRTVRRK